MAEDKGFAIAPWTAVRFDNKKTLFLSDSATAMGEYYFTGTDGSETKVEYTFQYRRAADGSLEDRRPPLERALRGRASNVVVCILRRALRALCCVRGARRLSRRCVGRRRPRFHFQLVCVHTLANSSARLDSHLRIAPQQHGRASIYL